ncbi:cadherin domain-containing protein [Bauldia sp.]|uniref:cadherin domain-containing protein n=1 Tax=Bauldia sp. TaxID=2575872 RepID=UPI003BAA66DC
MSDEPTITVVPPNPEPVLAAASTPGLSVTEDTPQNIKTFLISDNDPILRVVLTSDALMSLALLTGLNFELGTGINDQTMIFTGSVTDINAAIDLITYAPTLNDEGGGFIKVEVSDLINDPVSGTVTFDIVALTDPPEIISDGGGELANLAFAENAIQVTTVQAEDPDEGSVVSYDIVGGEDETAFTIDPVTGMLSFVQAPDFENPTDVGGDNTYRVVVEASDGLLTDTQEITVTVGDVAETITGTPNNDLLPGDVGSDVIKGKAGDDVIIGFLGDDILIGNRGNDILSGGPGDDMLKGGRGSDKLFGWAGSDTFVFSAKPKAKAFDTIFNFEVGVDMIHLDSSVFTALGGPGPLAAQAFDTGRKADDADDRIILRKKTGELSYDEDGMGGKDQIKIAELDRRLKLSEDDFLVI